MTSLPTDGFMFSQAVLEDMVVSAAQEQDTSSVRMLHMSAIPDTLYMVDEQHCSSAPYAVSPVSTVDIIAGTIPGKPPLPSTTTTCFTPKLSLVFSYSLYIWPSAFKSMVSLPLFPFSSPLAIPHLSPLCCWYHFWNHPWSVLPAQPGHCWNHPW